MGGIDMTVLIFPNQTRTSSSDDEEDNYVFDIIREVVLMVGVLMGCSFAVGVVLGALVF